MLSILHCVDLGRKEFRASRAQFKEDIVKIAKSIITESEVVIKIAMRVADVCTNVTLREVGIISYPKKLIDYFCCIVLCRMCVEL